jgi:phospholipase/carboxylesterase
MLSESLSLIHKVVNPDIDRSNPPPLLLILHGFGSNEEALISFVPQLDRRFFIVSIRAPIVLKSGSYSWFPMNLKKTGIPFDLQEVENCRFLLLDFIDELIKTYTLNSHQIYLMGFSQGAIMSFSLALTKSNMFAGVVAMSGNIQQEVLQQMHNLNLVDTEGLIGLPIFVAHGSADSMLPIQSGRNSRDLLKTLSVDLTYREYTMGHKVSDESIGEIGAWLTKQLDLSLARVGDRTSQSNSQSTYFVDRSKAV